MALNDLGFTSGALAMFGAGLFVFLVLKLVWFLQDFNRFSRLVTSKYEGNEVLGARLLKLMHDLKYLERRVEALETQKEETQN